MFKHLKLENFRSHKKFVLDLEQTTVLVGRNGTGKSNVLEAVTMLSCCRSFREEDKKNLINSDSDYARITGDDLEIFLARSPRLLMQAKVNGLVKKAVDFIGTLPAIIFSAETISIISGSPADRRRFIDVMVSQTNKEYFRALVDYKKVKQERNVLLQRIRQREATESELSFWDKELIRLGNIIIKTREEAILALNINLPSYYQKISGDKKSMLKIVHRRNFEGDLEENLRRFRFREIASGNTIIGPHRDDLIFLLKEKNMDNFASRGEIKSAILALKICELKFIESALEKDKDNRNYKSPILLLDDIFSEFDPDRRAHLGGLIAEYQSLITSTETANLPPKLLEGSKIVEIS